MNRRPKLSIIAPDASAEEAAAVVAALAQFMRSAAPAVIEPVATPSPWVRAALLEGVTRQPDELPHWE
jgi:hypothetical protein